MGTSDNVVLLGRLAVKYKLISMDQLNEVTALQARQGGRPPLGEILVDEGLISEHQLGKLLEVQKGLLAKHREQKVAERKAQGGAAARAAAMPLTAPKTPSAETARRESAPAPKKKKLTQVESEPSGLDLATESAPSRSMPQPTAQAPVAEVSPPAPVQGAAQVAPQTTASALRPTLSTTPGTPDPELLRYLDQGVQQGASDVHVHSGAKLRMRSAAGFTEVGSDPLDPDRCQGMILSVLSQAQRAMFEDAGELDFSCSLEGVGRFRVNIYRQQRGLDGVFRRIPPEPPSLDDLSLPHELAALTNFHQGMVLVTGPVGCGKSSTLAALVNLVNEERHEHILSIEDPIECLHPSKRCLVNQRQVNIHTDSFGAALRAALREDPDVIVIGELRDYETISLALTAAETGHFVLGTLHTNDAIRTINRLIGVFPPDQQGQVRGMLSEALKAVISQRLVPRADGNGRIPVLEKLVVNKPVGNLIRENKTFQLGSILQTGKSQGMWLMDQHLNELVRAGKITRKDALLFCEDPKKIGR